MGRQGMVLAEVEKSEAAKSGSTELHSRSVLGNSILDQALHDWILELACVFIAIVFWSAMSILMSKYNGTYTSQWLFQLPTLVAIISTCLRASLVFVVMKGECVPFKSRRSPQSGHGIQYSHAKR